MKKPSHYHLQCPLLEREGDCNASTRRRADEGTAFWSSVGSMALLLLSMITFSLTARAQDVSDLYRQLSPSVVTIKTVGAGSQSERSAGLGSGVIIDHDGRVITAAHVVHTASRIVVEMTDGQLIEASVVTSVPSADVALLKMAWVPDGLKPAQLGNSDSTLIGMPVFIIGSPFGLGQSLSVGHVSGRLNQGQVTNGEVIQVIQTDAAVNQGNSGGPMFNERGEVVGIVSRILSRSGGFEGISFAVAINPARAILLESSSFWTGFDAVFLGPQLAQALNIRKQGGLLVQRVVKDSMAGQAGLAGGMIPATLLGQEILLGGDVVLSIHGTTCESPHDFVRIREALDKLQDGNPFFINIVRGGKEITLTGLVDRPSLSTDIRR